MPINHTCTATPAGVPRTMSAMPPCHHASGVPVIPPYPSPPPPKLPAMTVNGVGPDEHGNVTLPVDAELSPESVNPVQNRAVHDALAGKADLSGGKVPDSQLPNYVDGAVYDSQARKIVLRHGSATVAEIDATAFIKDGMVSGAAVAGGKLVITFNTDSGKQPIEIPLTDIFNPDAYYDKGTVDAKLAPKADKTITVVPAHGLPADCYPVVYVKNGTTHTIAGDADIRECGPRYYALYDSDAMVCYFTKSTGKYFIGADITSITFNGTAPTQDTWPVLTSAAVTSDVVYGKDIVAPSTAPAASGKAADAKATGDSIQTLSNTKASKADATLTPIYSGTPTFSEWTFSDVSDGITNIQQPVFIPSDESAWQVSFGYDGQTLTAETFSRDENATNLSFEYDDEGLNLHLTATRSRTDIIGYTLGDQSGKPLQPKGDYAPATNIAKSALASDVQASLGKADAALSRDEVEAGFTEWTFSDGRAHEISGPVLDSEWIWVLDDTWGCVEQFATEDEALKAVSLSFIQSNINVTATRTRLPTMADVNAKAARAANPTAGNLAALDAQGNPTDSLIPAANVAVKGNIPYDLVTKTIANGAVTLDDRASNAVAVSAALSPNTLTINFPTATSGKVRDFALRLNIASGVTAPEIAWPQGVTLENDGGEVPEIADGGTGGSSTILYFSETENDGTTAKFLVKGETLTAIARPQA